MPRTLALAVFVALALLPGTVSAATLTNARSLVVSEPIEENAYLAGSDVSVAAPLSKDLLAAGGTLTVSAPIGEDALLAGGRVDVRKPVAGDLRAVAADLFIDSTIGGDLMAAAGIITASTTAKDMYLVGGTVRVAGAGGDVTAYGADIYLSGTIPGDVTVFASDRLFIAEDTHILGSLKYDAPQQVAVPTTATVEKGVAYTGSSSFLPTNEEAKRFAIAGAGVMVIVRVLAVVIAAGLVAGLFPAMTMLITERVIGVSARRSILLALLGFAVIVAAPVLVIFLLVSFVGILVAILLAALYVLLLLLAYLYAGVVAGAALSRALMKREEVTWRTAVLGTLALYLIGIVPVVGALVVAFLMSASLGALVGIAYKTAFGGVHEDDLLEFAEEETA